MGESYNSLLGFGITIIIEVLKCEGQCPSLKHTLVILIIILKHALLLMILLRCLHDNLSGPELDKLLHLAIELMNSSSKKGTHSVGATLGILSKALTST